MLLAAGGALVDQPRLVRPRPLVAAAGAAEPVRPARPEQVLTALGIGAEALQKARQIIARQVGRSVGSMACFHPSRTLVRTRWIYRKLKNFRSGIEANISCLKGAYGSGSMHLARARPLPGVRVVSGGGPQSRPPRPPKAQLTSPATPAGRFRISGHWPRLNTPQPPS